MTTGVRDPDARYDRIAQVLDFFFAQKIKALHTTIPGLVTAYDPLTKRANVQPALRMLLADGSEIEKPPILDVPLQQPAHGGHMVHQQVDVGDVVVLLFSKRGLEKFKLTWGAISSQGTGLFDERGRRRHPLGGRDHSAGRRARMGRSIGRR